MKMVFTPEEAWLAGQLTRIPETAAEIAKAGGPRRGRGHRAAREHDPAGHGPRRPGPRRRGDWEVLRQPGRCPGREREEIPAAPVHGGLVRVLSAGGQPDKEFAELFEQFIIEGGGERIFAPRPGRRASSRPGSLKPEYVQREPHIDIDAHFQRHERFLVIPCVCKREMEILHGQSCKKAVKRCGFVGLPPQTPLGETVLDREEATKLLTELGKQGHVNLAFYGFTMFAEAPQFIGTCNCCSCCCGILHGPKLAGLDMSTKGPQRSNYRAVIDEEKCTACGACIKRCPVDAISEGPKRLPLACPCGRVPELRPGKSQVDRDKCIGCGVCVIGCPENAIVMEPVSEEEWFHVPSSMGEWEEMRLQYLASQK